MGSIKDKKVVKISRTTREGLSYVLGGTKVDACGSFPQPSVFSLLERWRARERGGWVYGILPDSCLVTLFGFCGSVFNFVVPVWVM